jgi:hypothetical protein
LARSRQDAQRDAAARIDLTGLAAEEGSRAGAQSTQHTQKKATRRIGVTRRA